MKKIGRKVIYSNAYYIDFVPVYIELTLKQLREICINSPKVCGFI